MNWTQILYFSSACFFIVFPTTCMKYNLQNNVLIQTSDNQFVRLPQWKIEESRLMHRKQELQKAQEKYYGIKSNSIVLKKVCLEQLKLFSAAFDAKNFKEYVSLLNPKQYRTLVSIAGREKLDSPILTIKLLNCCFNPEWLKSCLYPHFTEIITVHNSLKQSVIIDNNLNQLFVQKASSYTGDSAGISFKSNGHYSVIPKLVRNNYNGYTSKNFIKISEDKFQINLIKPSNKIIDRVYYITSAEPLLKDAHQPYTYMQKLWQKNLATEKITLEKTIQLHHNVRDIIFSNDGNYIALSSNGLDSELMLINTNQQENTSAFSHIFLKQHENEITSLCFNNQSTILAVGSQNGIQLWDIKKVALLKKIAFVREHSFCPIFLLFNKNDTRFAICYNEPDRTVIELWDTTAINTMHKIASFCVNAITKIKIFNTPLEILTFDALHNVLIIRTDSNVVLAHESSGKIIMQTEEIQDDSARYIFETAVSIPTTNILATATISSTMSMRNIKLWDINSGILIAQLSHGKGITGIGVSDDGRSIVTTFKNDTMIQTDLYNDNAANCFDWIKNKTNLLQKYLLLRLHSAQKHNDPIEFHSDSSEFQIFSDLPTEPHNVKEIVEKYLLIKS